MPTNECECSIPNVTFFLGVCSASVVLGVGCEEDMLRVWWRAFYFMEVNGHTQRSSRSSGGCGPLNFCLDNSFNITPHRHHTPRSLHGHHGWVFVCNEISWFGWLHYAFASVCKTGGLPKEWIWRQSCCFRDRKDYTKWLSRMQVSQCNSSTEFTHHTYKHTASPHSSALIQSYFCAVGALHQRRLCWLLHRALQSSSPH